MNTSTKEIIKNRNGTAPPPKTNPLELYHVIIQCTDESQQRELYERLTREGLRCRVIVL